MTRDLEAKLGCIACDLEHLAIKIEGPVEKGRILGLKRVNLALQPIHLGSVVNKPSSSKFNAKFENRARVIQLRCRIVIPFGPILGILVVQSVDLGILGVDLFGLLGDDRLLFGDVGLGCLDRRVQRCAKPQISGSRTQRGRAFGILGCLGIICGFCRLDPELGGDFSEQRLATSPWLRRVLSPSEAALQFLAWSAFPDRRGPAKWWSFPGRWCSKRCPGFAAHSAEMT